MRIYQFFAGLDDDGHTWRLVLNFGGANDGKHASVPFGNRSMGPDELADRYRDAEWALCEGLEKVAPRDLRELQARGWLPIVNLITSKVARG